MGDECVFKVSHAHIPRGQGSESDVPQIFGIYISVHSIKLECAAVLQGQPRPSPMPGRKFLGTRMLTCALFVVANLVKTLL